MTTDETRDDVARRDPTPTPEVKTGNPVERLVNRVIRMESGVARAHIARFGAGKTGPALLKRLDHQFQIALAGSGAAVGAVAAFPGVGTAAGVALSGGDVALNLEATMLYVLSYAEAHGVEIDDVEQRRAVLMAIMLGQSGRQVVQTLIGESGGDWGKTLALLPKASLRTLNAELRKRFVKRYGAQQGVMALGRLAPFGIGAVLGGVAGSVSSRAVIKATHRAFEQYR